jgi:hypothetical protein
VKLNIDFFENTITDELLRQERIPRFCKVSKEFEISFSDTVPESSGVVSEWHRRELMRTNLRSNQLLTKRVRLLVLTMQLEAL